jgi:hypothetical protein
MKGSASIEATREPLQTVKLVIIEQAISAA